MFVQALQFVKVGHLTVRVGHILQNTEAGLQFSITIQQPVFIKSKCSVGRTSNASACSNYSCVMMDVEWDILDQPTTYHWKLIRHIEPYPPKIKHTLLYPNCVNIPY